MDIKSKDNISKVISNLLIILLIFAVSIGAVYSGKFIKEDASKRNMYNIFEGYEFISDIENASYSIYYNMHSNNDGAQKKPSELFMDKIKLQNENDSERIIFIAEGIDGAFYENDDFLKHSIMNLDYYATDSEGKSIQRRGNEKLGELLKDKPDNAVVQQLNSEYQFYVVLKYDKQGNISYDSIHGADLQRLRETMSNKYNVLNGYEKYVFPVKDTSIVYGVLKDLKYSDHISYYIEDLQENLYINESMKYLIPALVFVLLCAMIIPYKYEERLNTFKLFKKVPIEILAALLCLLVAGYMVFVFMMWKKVDGSLFRMLNEMFLNKNVAEVSEVIVSVGFAFILVLFTFLFVVLVKYIFKTGLKKYFKEHCLVWRICTSMGRCIKRVGRKLSSIDLKDKNTKKLITILGINLIIMIFISSIWFFGIFIAIAYTGFLYYIIEKKTKEVIKNYNALLEATDSMGDGHLDIDMEDDIGPFNSMRDELKNVQKGFKKAVEEEVKSQRMKTELISNVSHDLKTPLTSIITYVDLLKGENVSDEERREYLDTIDKKSQRLKYLIEDLFEVTKANSGNMTLNIENIDLISLIKETLVELEDKINSSDLKIKTKFPEGKTILSLDGQRTFRVFDNLVSNITKYALHGSRVYIDVTEMEDIVQIEMKNISAEEMNFDAGDITERFQRGDKSRNTEGSGLGLAIAKSFVELQGGSFDIQIDGDLFKVIIIFTK